MVENSCDKTKDIWQLIKTLIFSVHAHALLCM